MIPFFPGLMTGARSKVFEIGKTYMITMIVIEDGELVEEVDNWTVAGVDGTLIKLTSPHAEDMIVNTASLHFVSAQISKHQS